MTGWSRPPFDPHHGESAALTVCCLALAAGFGLLVWLLDRTAP